MGAAASSWLCGDPVPVQCVTTTISGLIPTICAIVCLLVTRRSTNKTSTLICMACLLCLGANVAASLTLDPWDAEPAQSPQLVISNYTILAAVLHVLWTGCTALLRKPICATVISGVAMVDRIAILVSMRDTYWNDTIPPTAFWASEAFILASELCLAAAGLWKACSQREEGGLRERLLQTADMETGSQEMWRAITSNRDEDLFPEQTSIFGWAAAYVKMHGKRIGSAFGAICALQHRYISSCMGVCIKKFTLSKNAYIHIVQNTHTHTHTHKQNTITFAGAYIHTCKRTGHSSCAKLKCTQTTNLGSTRVHLHKTFTVTHKQTDIHTHTLRNSLSYSHSFSNTLTLRIRRCLIPSRTRSPTCKQT
jgi:hypothetical protein